MKLTKIVLLLSSLLTACTTTQTYDKVLVWEGNPQHLIQIGGEWVHEGNALTASGGKKYLVTEELVSDALFEMEAELRIDGFQSSNASFILWGNNLNFDAKDKNSAEPVMTFSGDLAGKPVVIGKTADFIRPAEPFVLKVKSEQQAIVFYIDGKKIFDCPAQAGKKDRIGFRTGTAGMAIYSFRMNGETEKQAPLAYLYKNGEGGYDTFRIPALVVSNQGTVLAFAEGRKNSASDTGNIDIVLKRSNDSGKTWSPLQVVWDDAENTCGNPMPVVDKETGTIFLLSTHNLGTDYERDIVAETSQDTRRVFVLQSTDDGQTWSAAKEITKNVKKDHWTWYATGPCQGIQLMHGKYKGRLVVPADHIEAKTQKYFSHVIYSDDHGKTWKLGGRTPSDQVNECTVAELEGGNILLNMRNYDRQMRTRKVSISDDGGQSWSELRADPMLIEPICQGSLHRYSFQAEGKGRLLFLNPACVDARKNMTLRISYDDGQSWSYSQVLYPGPAAYSDLTRLPDGRIGCFYEAGYAYPYEGIVFETIDLSKIEN